MHRLIHALLQGPDSWRLRLQLQKLAGVQRVLDTVDNNVHDESYLSFDNVALPSLVSTTTTKVLVFHQAGKDCLTKISTVSKYNVKILVSLWGLTRSSEARCLIVQQVTTVVRVWPKSELAEHCDDLLLLLTGAIQDPKDFVRAAAREALCAFAETWYGRVYQVVA
ncbi:hypothetical protein DYB28_012868 [Aphanomyces astaci]|uniref:CLASP N-terminal domain-containing protein n=1 Tax=Aphanomyces astaci TaxID=112090 RepID=A0A9X8DT92_APHAT|nr:hypothetical protein DYB28_012868 [Aphanomyces astaci]